MCPELGGTEAHLDIMGHNYYYNNQWIAAPHQFLEWKPGLEHRKYIPLHELLIAAFHKYNRPFVLTETSHPKEDRPLWIKMITEEALHLLKHALPF